MRAPMETARSVVAMGGFGAVAADSWDAPCHAMLFGYAPFDGFPPISLPNRRSWRPVTLGVDHAQHDAGLSADRDGHSAARHRVELESKGHHGDLRRVSRHQLRRARDAVGAACSRP